MNMDVLQDRPKYKNKSVKKTILHAGADLSKGDPLMKKVGSLRSLLQLIFHPPVQLFFIIKAHRFAGSL